MFFLLLKELIIFFFESERCRFQYKNNFAAACPVVYIFYINRSFSGFQPLLRLQHHIAIAIAIAIAGGRRPCSSSLF